MNWCCSTFNVRYEHAGEMGFATLVGRDVGGKPQFVIQHRAVHKELEQAVKPEVPTRVVSEIPIAFCPWCGRKLDKWYGQRVDGLYRPDLKLPSG